MAQTIAVQRGTTTVTGNGITKTTLFTQSGGIATRVILVGVSANIASGQNSHSLALFINVNGTGNLLPVAYVMTNYTNYNTVYMLPDKAGSSPLTMQSGNTGFFAGTASFAGNANGGIVNGLTNAVVPIAGTTGYQNPYYNSPLSLVPSQFWMASGDSLVASSFNAGEQTPTIVYHFVTITES